MAVHHACGTEDQAALAATLLAPHLPCPTGLRTWNASDPARRWAVHRNNVVSSLIDGLADTFDVTLRLVGTAFFRAMAAEFVRAHPPVSRILTLYGEAFPAFVADFGPASGLPYLADVARLEYARIQACHAADVDAINSVVLTRTLEDPDRLSRMLLRWHPSVRVIRSRHAIVTLWAAHQADGDVPGVDIDVPEQALVLRDGLEPVVIPASRGSARFVAEIAAERTFGAAAATALEEDPAFDLFATLSLVLRYGALTGVEVAPPTRQSKEIP